ncbi:MAG: hypothetical protein CBD54_003225 [Alphaproteobacteria bacterium TMED194]|nr:MAG: hypothetical protein CBD54_003225 [Alphaproteobacteria bacterium TMED194]
MINVGVSAGFHDAASTTLNGKEIIFANHCERYSQIKGDPNFDDYVLPIHYDNIAFYEKPFLKNTRRLFAGQRMKWPNKKYDYYFGHHETHAAAGYYTSPFNECNVLVVDAIGEWNTISIWEGKDDKLKKLKTWNYPYSLGLLYSAITRRIGLKPNEDEYITMGMAAFGEPKYDLEYLLHKNNHRGVGKIFPRAHPNDLAASVQNLYETKFLELLKYCEYSNIVIMGGCALNCVANSKIPDRFNIWIMPSPGDAGSSLGAAALIEKKKIRWRHPYLGHNIIAEKELNPKEIVQYLLENKVCGVANGRAEFGPRALGNRSLLADPRLDIKDTVNEIKQRQKFRPFAPAILEEHFDDYFVGRKNRYMQFVCKAKHDYKSVTHIDGTARVQCVEKDNISILRPILEEWYNETGCPMLLNTSLNIRGKPMVNNYTHAGRFEKKYNVKVFR